MVVLNSTRHIYLTDRTGCYPIALPGRIRITADPNRSRRPDVGVPRGQIAKSVARPKVGDWFLHARRCVISGISISRPCAHLWRWAWSSDRGGLQRISYRCSVRKSIGQCQDRQLNFKNWPWLSDCQVNLKLQSKLNVCQETVQPNRPDKTNLMVAVFNHSLPLNS